MTIDPTKKDAFTAFAEERRRQIEEKFFTPIYDDNYVEGDLARAAASYSLSAAAAAQRKQSLKGVPGLVHEMLDATGKKLFPWPMTWFKPNEVNRSKRDIEKAGALLAAEWERIDREEIRERAAAAKAFGGPFIADLRSYVERLAEYGVEGDIRAELHRALDELELHRLNANDKGN